MVKKGQKQNNNQRGQTQLIKRSNTDPINNLNELRCSSMVSSSHVAPIVLIGLMVRVQKEKFEDTKDIIRSLKSKDMQCNGRNKTEKINTTQKTNDCVTRTSFKTRDKLQWSLIVSSSSATSDTSRVTLLTNPGDTLWSKGLGCNYGKRNISMVICDTSIP